MDDPQAIDVLIVDNVRLYRRIVEHMFVDTCLRVHFAETAETALDLAATNEFSIVCGAMHLPDMTGLELCRRLRRLPMGKATPFVLLTSDEPGKMLAEAYAAGVTDVIERDSPHPLVTMLARLLAHREPIAGKVLVIEDEGSQAAFVRAALAGIGLECDIAASAEQALPLLKAGQYDLVVLDLVLAGAMSGVMLASQIRRLEGERGEVPVLAATGFDDLSRRIELFRLGVDDYVIKPIVVDELTARARRLIGHSRLLRKMRAERGAAEADREEARRELAYRASHDALTGLSNRWAFEEALSQALANPLGGGTGLALVDVGALRMVNHASGREAGDDLMREVGRRAKDMPARVVARLEGARLGVLVEGDTPATRGDTVERILKAIDAAPFVHGDRQFPLRLAAGALLSLNGARNPEEALARAETAVAAARTNGGLLAYDPSDERISTRERERSVLPDLLGALDEGRVTLFTQRIAPLRAWQARQGHEFLCRIVTPGGQVMEPTEFLSTAERYGLMRRLDRDVTARAIEWLAKRQDRLEEGALDFYTINLSGQTVGDLDFVGFVRDRLQATGVPAERIYFEITESAVIGDPDAAREFMALIGRLGCRFALDDFGSGTASYGQLKQLPVQLIKIDGQFVTHLLDSALDRAIVRSTCEVARALGLPTVAEFVENEAQVAALRAIGVDYAQGYGIGLPGPVAAPAAPASSPSR